MNPDVAPMPADDAAPTTPTATTAGTTSARPTGQLWRIRFTATPRRPDAIVTAPELDAYYRRTDVFEITAHTRSTP